MDKFKPGQLVTVHQHSGLLIGNQIHDGGHDCSDPSQHWKSRVLYYRHDYDGLPVIAIEAKNPNHAEWPYTDDVLTACDDEDWAPASKYKPGDKVFFRMFQKNHSQYPEGKMIEARILQPHIEEGDWYLEFPTKDGWEFNMVVNEWRFRDSAITT